jgi:hypothetical protein
MSNRSLNEFRKQKLGATVQTTAKQNSVIHDFIDNISFYNRRVFIHELKTSDYDSLVFALNQKGVTITSDSSSCDTILTSSKNPIDDIDKEIINLNDYFLSTANPNPEMVDYEESTPVTITKSRIIPLDESRFIGESLMNLRVSFLGDFNHFNHQNLVVLIQKLGGKVVDNLSEFDLLICGKGVNPLDITDSLQKVLSERDFIRKISR